MNTVVDRLNGLIRAKRDMREAINECDVTVWGGLVVYPEAVSQIVPKDAPLVMHNGWRLEGSTFEESPVIDISNMNNIDRLFKDCVNLKVVRLIGSPGKITSTTDAFLNCGKNGILYYDSRYGYSKIIRVLPDGWESVRYNTKDYGFD